jgi:4'-phosphopantetheinyl transferase
MPIVEDFAPWADARARLFRLDESTRELLDSLALESFPADIRLEKRQREWAGRAFLLREAGLGGTVGFLPNGKPVLESGFVSFSHSGALVGMLLSAEPCGLDIQRPDPKLTRIRDKFADRAEFEGPEETEDSLTLTALWAMKEAVFKIHGEGVNFKDVIRTGPNEAAWKEHRYELNFRTSDDALICCARLKPRDAS